MISATTTSEYSKRIGLDSNNLFKFKAPRQTHQDEGDGMNEILSSPSGEDESIEQQGRLLLDQSIKGNKQADKKSKIHNQTQDFGNHNNIKKVKRSSTTVPVAAPAQSVLLNKMHEQHTLSHQINGEENLFQEETEEDDAKIDHTDIFGIHSSHHKSHINLTSNNIQRSKQNKKRISIQSESTPALGGDVHEQDFDDIENNQSMEEEDLQEQGDIEDVGDDQEQEDDGIEEEDQDEKEDDHIGDDEDEEEEDDDDDGDDNDNDSEQEEQSEDLSVTKKKGQNTNINSAKSPPAKKSKSTRKQNKKPGRKGHCGRGKHHETKASHSNSGTANHNSKRCHNLFCKFPYKGDLKRVKIKFTSEYVHLCQKCTERFKQKCYCLYCGQVYYDSNEGDGKVWIQCEDCQFWLHQECEKENGLGDIDTLIEDESYKFYCMRCRDKNKPQQQDKLSLNILKAQQQIAKTFQAQNGGFIDSANNNTTNGLNSPSTQKQLKRQYNKQQKEKIQAASTKTKVKVSLASLQKQLNKPIFAPKPDQVENQNAQKNTASTLIHLNNSLKNEQVVEPKKQKKICTEESKQNGSAHQQNHSKASPQVHNQTNINTTNSSEYYSASLFLKAKKQLQLQEQQNQQQQFTSYSPGLINHKDQINFQYQHQQQLQQHNSFENQITPYDHNTNGITDIHGNNSQINKHSHHSRKDDPMNYVELPYKKQTVKENTSKRVYYHYSILQELLTPLSISMTLAQEDINEDLQILRSLILEGKRNSSEETQFLQHSHLYENQMNLSSSSQYDSIHNKSSPQQYKGSEEFVNLTPVKRKAGNEDHHTQSINSNSPFMSHH